jgi:hypothetical protein
MANTAALLHDVLARLDALEQRNEALDHDNAILKQQNTALLADAARRTMTDDLIAEIPGSPLERMSRRWVLRRGFQAAAATAVIAAVGRQQDVEAAPLTDDWHLGGNTAVSTDGTNYLGTRNVAPLVFKTAATANTPLERLRITPAGNVGIGTTTPTAKLQANSTGVSILGRHTGTSGSAPGVRGETSATVVNASGVQGVVTPVSPGVDSAGVLGQNLGTNFNANGTGVRGIHAGYGIGVRGTSAGGYGVQGDGAYAGVRGDAASYGVMGSASAANGVGVYAAVQSDGEIAPDAIGVYGLGTTGVLGQTTRGTGVEGISPQGAGVRGYGSPGVYGEGTGLRGTGIIGRSVDGKAGYFSGDVEVLGALTKGAGSFKIDHPLAPDTKYLSHSFVESPDMLNIYNDNVMLDSNGEATVELPAYFDALNRDVRYQLTPIGAFAGLYVAEEIQGTNFKIAGGKPGMRVSWQVTGIRQDAFANANRIPVEEDKVGDERGTYLHPAVHGKPESAGVDVKRLAVLHERNVPGQPTLPPHR